MNRRFHNVRVNKKSLTVWLLFVLAALVLYLASGVLYLGVLLLTLAAGLGLSFAASAFSGADITLRITGRELGAGEEEAAFLLSFSNNGKVPVFGLACEIVAKNLLTGECVRTRELLSLGPGQKKRVEISTPVKHCGCIETQVADTCVTDPFAIFKREIRLNGAGCQYIFPQYGELEIGEETLNAYDMESYKFSGRRKGSDPSETFSLKPYAPGDSVKAIHWKLSAKTDEIIIKESSLPVENKLIVVVDKCTACTPDRADEIASYTASVCYSLLKKGIAHSLGWYDAAEKTFAVREIRSEENFQTALREFLRTPFTEDSRSTPYHFAEADMEKPWSGCLYIGEDERDLERLRVHAEVTRLCPRQN